MFNVLPLLSLVFLFLIFASSQRSWRYSFLAALIIWGVILTAITELLSLLKLLTFGWLLVLWLAIDIGLIATYWRFYGRNNHLISYFKNHLKTIVKLPFFSQLLVGSITLIVGVVGLIAIVAPPNHSDSMEYHMSRVVHWIQNYSLAHYPTTTLEQLYQNPWSEFAITHFQILSGGDRFANLIQWGSMVASLIGVSLIAKQLGAQSRGQILSVVFCATIPMGILQSSSTNNDYVVALWLVCFAYFTLLTIKEGVNLTHTCLLGASLGLGILTKGTAYIYAFPFCLWLAFWGIQTLRWRVWKPVLIVLAIMMAINLNHYIRNFLLFGSPLGLSTGETNKEFSLVIWISSLSKNLSLHADFVRYFGLEKIITPTTGITNKVIQILHQILGLDINDVRTMSPKVSRFYVPALSTYEDTASNPGHLLLTGISFLLLIINKHLRKNSSLVTYFIVVLAGFLLFCFLFTWSPWRCRLHLPVFILFAPFVGIVLSKSLNYRITNGLAVLLIVLSYPCVFQNSTRPLLGENSVLTTPRIDQYFITQQQFQTPYVEAVQVTQSQNCSNIGLILEGTSFEYPLWRLFKQDQPESRIQFVNVNNESANVRPSVNVEPCAILSITTRKTGAEQEKELIHDQTLYPKYWSTDFAKGSGKGSVQVFLKQ
ncbi:MAG: glycosyltransferase family 39 protein [Coleofasciculus sp. D1-CHI-01]|uniref:ArnT family glycosyltransferase n=1 Tax=Coleofasciculus sp. D1-CHI-01 TaxID=3068482 RepID=UPI0032F54034